MKKSCGGVILRVARRIGVIILILILPILSVSCYYGAKPYIDTVDKICEDYAIEPELALAVCKAESNFNTNVVSRAGAIGIMQILPSTALWICELRNMEYKEEYLYRAEFNIELGVWYLSYLSYFEDRNWQLAAYNAGEGTVKNWQKQGINLENIPYSETRSYIDKVNKYYDIFKKRNFFN
ncbi:MAG: lytic transglycosylase domain-containing protein [Clostridia bacterium]|nr:lytic transglycosylase domain-containing protein [Clostridia bacterium]